jgi:hypothetical protein
MNKLPYIVIIILLVVIFLQRTGCKNSNPCTIDTMLVKHDTTYISIHDTVKGASIFISGKVDTLWKHDSFYEPSNNYDTLLKQYDDLVNKYFTTKLYKTRFPIKNYGYVDVYDSVLCNSLKSSKLINNLLIPETHDTVRLIHIQHDEPKRQLYIGGSVFFQNDIDPLTGIQIGLLYKDKKDRIFTISTIYDGGFSYGAGCYWKIKLK